MRISQTIDLLLTSIPSPLVKDYLSNHDITSMHEYVSANIENFEKIISIRQAFNAQSRSILVNHLRNQYSHMGLHSEAALKNIELLQSTDTYTVTTGHQLCIFGGPLYFIYKIASVVALCRQLKVTYPSKHFVPVYWLASEDHDMEEIAKVNVAGNELHWPTTYKGVSGNAPLFDIAPILAQIQQLTAGYHHSNQLHQLFDEAYQPSYTLAKATMLFVDKLFSQYGVVVLDANSEKLKQQFANTLHKELAEQFSYYALSKGNELLHTTYDLQIKPRSINLFFINNTERSRIEKEDVGLRTVDGRHSILLEDDWIERHAKDLSPNVVLRPLYQETILPNVAYVGGPAEVHYWLQLLPVFRHANIVCPIIVLRDSFAMLDEKAINILSEYKFSWQMMEGDNASIVSNYLASLQTDTTPMNEEREKLAQIYADIEHYASSIDPTLEGAVRAELQKTLKGVESIEGRITKAIKRKEEIAINRLLNIKEKLYPKGIQQERSVNFAEYYAKYGQQFIDDIILACNPLAHEMKLMIA